MYTGFLINEQSRSEILQKFPPKFNRVICHHITHEFGVKPETPPPAYPKSVKIIGYAASEKIEALVVEINGNSKRPDGKTYHITLSLDSNSGAKPVHSNDLLKSGYEKCDPLFISVEPKNFFQ